MYFSDGDGFLVNKDFTTVGSWCNEAGDTFVVGDTNGDHHDDWICHHRDGTVCTKYNSHIFRGECYEIMFKEFNAKRRWLLI